MLFSITDDGTTETVNYLTHDHLNSPAAMLDYAGAILERFEYDAYGERHIFNADYSSVLASSTLTIGFTGQRVDILDNGGLVLCYYKNRWYLPEMGRFMSEDPLGVEPEGYENRFKPVKQYIDGFNLSNFAQNVPIITVDIYGFYSLPYDKNPFYSNSNKGFSKECYDECMKPYLEDYELTIKAADALRDMALDELARVWKEDVKSDCGSLPFPLNVACYSLARLGQGVAYGAIWDAWTAAQSGAAARLAVNSYACLAGCGECAK